MYDMHAYIFKTFEKILFGRDLSGPVLEIGATPNENTLLNLPALKNLRDKIGINMEGPYKFKDFTYHQGNANQMDIFSDNYFGIVLCNAMLEHDRFFWKTLTEIKRVTRPGGIVVIGTPGFSASQFHQAINRFDRFLWYRRLKSSKTLGFIFSSTRTLEVHGEAYGDFYRFSAASFRDVFFPGFEKVEIIEVMKPPRIIGLGYKPVM